MFLNSLRHRDRRPELMDQPGLDARAHHEALRGLARLNALSGSARIVRRPLFQLANQLKTELARTGRRLQVLDVATGAGDVPIRLAQMARRAGLPIEFTGYDISAEAVKHARQAASAAGVAVSFFERDVERDGVFEPFDAVMTSLFLHHLERDAAIDLLRKLGTAARRMLLVNDLSRSRRGYVLTVIGSRLLTRSPIVRTDGPLSVRAAFTPAEVQKMALKAGLSGAVVQRSWPCRLLLTWRRS